MSAEVKEQLGRTRLGAVLRAEHVAVFPLEGEGDGATDYVTLSEAMERGGFVVTEVGPGGSVPELRAENRLDRRVLLLDGEELAGAKQNRVLNTTVLVEAGSTLVIPVSCTEHGRWHYVAPDFQAAPHVMNVRARAAKVERVAESLSACQSFHGDQGRVWDEVACLRANVGVREGGTGAMGDAFEARRPDLDRMLAAFPAAQGQRGLLVLINGAVAGFDWVSRAGAYARLHPKLVRSYVIDALGVRPKKKLPDDEALAGRARAFLDAAAACEGSAHPSVGLGEDRRFRGPDLVGSALVFGGEVVHTAFFAATPAEQAGRMSDANRRRAYRTG